MTSWTVTCQAPLSMGFPRQKYWSGLPFPSPGDLPNPGIKPWCLLRWPADSLPLSHQGSPTGHLIGPQTNTPSAFLSQGFCIWSSSKPSQTIHLGICSNVSSKKMPFVPTSLQQHFCPCHCPFHYPLHFLYSTNHYLKLYNYLSIVLLPHQTVRLFIKAGSLLIVGFPVPGTQ